MEHQAVKGTIAKWYGGKNTIPPGWETFNGAPGTPLPQNPSNFLKPLTKTEEYTRYIFIIKE